MTDHDDEDGDGAVRDSGDAADLSPDHAFSLIGNETRLGVLGTLRRADGPLSFTELQDGVGVADSGQFNYHFSQLVGQRVIETFTGN